MTSAEAMSRHVERAGELAGGTPVTILVNNAGVNVRTAADDLTPEQWRLSLELMLTAPFFLALACWEGFKREWYGRIINVASLQSYQSFPKSIPYASAKRGLLGLARAMAEHFSTAHGFENVTANNVGPGYVRTELMASFFADEARGTRLAEATLLGRNSVPEDLVGPAVFLASPAAGDVTGQTLSTALFVVMKWSVQFAQVRKKKPLLRGGETFFNCWRRPEVCRQFSFKQYTFGTVGSKW